MTGEIVATHDLKSRAIQGRTQGQIHSEIVGSVRDSGKKVRKLFPW